MYFQNSRIKSLKKTFINVWSGRKRVFMHLCLLPDHQNQVLKKLLFSPLEWLKTCFDAFPDHQNQVLKNFFLTSGVVQNVFLCICSYIQTTRFKSLKNYVLASGVFLCICAYFQTTRIKSLKNYFFTSWVVKIVFWFIYWPPESSP